VWLGKREQGTSGAKTNQTKPKCKSISGEIGRRGPPNQPKARGVTPPWEGKRKSLAAGAQSNAETAPTPEAEREKKKTITGSGRELAQ